MHVVRHLELRGVTGPVEVCRVPARVERRRPSCRRHGHETVELAVHEQHRSVDAGDEGVVAPRAAEHREQRAGGAEEVGLRRRCRAAPGRELDTGR